VRLRPSRRSIRGPSDSERVLTLLVTGFGPFLDVPVNPSGLIAERLDGAELGSIDGGLKIVGRLLPVAFHAAAVAVTEAIALYRPTVVVLIGVARGPDYRLERVATPIVTSEQPDASGRGHLGLQLGSDPRESASSVAELADALGALGFDVKLSTDCGGYVCNSTYYSALGVAPGAVFLHIPPDTSEAALDHGCSLVRALLTLLAAPASRRPSGNPSV